MLPSQSLRKQDKNRGRSPTKKAECTTGYLFNLQSPMIQSITFFISFLASQNLIINPECGRESASKNTKILSVPKKKKVQASVEMLWSNSQTIAVSLSSLDRSYMNR